MQNMKKRMLKTAVLGDVNLDVILSGLRENLKPGTEILARDSVLKPGGSAANTALVLGMCGVPVRFFGVIGADLPGTLLTGELERSGLSTKWISRYPDMKTGVTVSLSQEQDRMYTTYPGSVSEAGIEHIKKGFIIQGGHLHLASYYLQNNLKSYFPDILARAKAAGMTTSLDPGSDPEGRWDRAVLEEILPLVDWFLPNLDELRSITGKKQIKTAVKILRTAGDGMVIKAGVQGAYLVLQDVIEKIPAEQTEQVDATCAGDAFNSGFICSMIIDGDPVKACTVGNRIGALTASVIGLPEREQIQKELTR